MGRLSKPLVEVLIALAAVIGIGFALMQWFLVSKIKLSEQPAKRTKSKADDGVHDDEEEGSDGSEAVRKCAEIQNAISIGERFVSEFLSIYGMPKPRRGF